MLTFTKLLIKLLNLLLIFFVISCISCSNKVKPNNRKNLVNNNYLLKRDSHPNPAEIPNLSLVKEPVPVYEPKSRYGNPSKYKVFNKVYRVLKSSKGYKESGYASWYGTKFHGFRTSSGEIYDMYAMTAAHKTLPLPTYAKITNMTNKRSVIVKINDRGPFHGNRIIDLSYAAANKLGILGSGVGKVEVVAINPILNKKNLNDTLLIRNKVSEVKMNKDQTNTDYNKINIKQEKNSVKKLQVGAFSMYENANKLAKELNLLMKKYSFEAKDHNLYQINIIKNSLKKNSKKNTLLYKVVLSFKEGSIDTKKIEKILAKLNQKVFI